MKFLISLILLLSLGGFSQNEEEYFDTGIGGDWHIIGYVGDIEFFDEESYVGKIQYVDGGFTEGPFLNCPIGLRNKGEIYSNEEFLTNKEFTLFKKYNDQLNITSEKIVVLRLACVRNGLQLNPFIKASKRKGYYLFGNVIFILERKFWGE